MVYPIPVFRAVVPGNEYRYRVRSGAAGARWSEVYGFRAPGGTTNKSTGARVTRFATYGDMGHTRYGTFRLNFHRFDRFELDLRGRAQP